MDLELKDLIKRTNALACEECDCCTRICPISRISKDFSPRALLTQTIREDFDAIFRDYNLWNCLTCKRCEPVCQANIHFIELIQILRRGAKDAGFKGVCSHAGAMELLQQIMVSKDLKQDRLEWVTKDMKIADKGEILYFVGCAPYLDTFFSDLKLDILDAAKSSVKLLNKLGITPVVMADERCCGHDLFWNGDMINFKVLAKFNLEAIKNTGAKTILFSCAECLSAFKQLYPQHVSGVNAELKHMSQFLAEKVNTGELKLSPLEKKVTFHDPCRLGRHLKIYDEPRLLLRSGDSENFREMRHNKKRSLCCGVSAWMNCDITSRALQVQRLKQAKDIKTDIMAVACAKCQIHFVCTMKKQAVKEDFGFEIRDISSIVLERLK